MQKEAKKCRSQWSFHQIVSCNLFSMQRTTAKQFNTVSVAVGFPKVGPTFYLLLPNQKSSLKERFNKGDHIRRQYQSYCISFRFSKNHNSFSEQNIIDIENIG